MTKNNYRKKLRDILNGFIGCGEETSEICDLTVYLGCGKGASRRMDKDDKCVVLEKVIDENIKLKKNLKKLKRN